MRLLLRKPSKNPVDVHIIVVTLELCRFKLRIGEVGGSGKAF